MVLPQSAADGKRAGESRNSICFGYTAKDFFCLESGHAMNCQEMIEAMAAKGYWTSPGGKTPSATLYSSILRELKTKGGEARFRKTERGRPEIV
jgi:hypothetical protein